jgi:LuxR family maltose regulon positive regulatory protein
VGATRALQRRRIIERPRLIALLDESTARVRTLIAPAGYGKTTLAEQWVEKEGRRGAWFTARPSSTDVAALALGIARAATEIVPECDLRLREHLRALPAPAEHVDVLAELLGEDLQGWPTDAWLVLDDYQEVAGSEDAEKFIEELVAASPIQLLIASRQRPSWITTRRILYGEILELNQTELAMDGHEAAEVLTERNAASASGLVALANGWPAVIGLASVSAAEIDDHDSVPESLYQFFAEEVFSALDCDVQQGLATLAIAPIIDRTLAGILLGESAERICTAALDLGILVERGARLEIHPLARAFLEERHDASRVATAIDGLEKGLEYFRERRDWDAAFDLVARRGRPSQLEALLEDALDELLDTARLSTVESWCDHAKAIGSTGAIFMLGRAEVALRRDRLAEAQAYGEAIAAQPSPWAFRGLLTAGRAAHLASVDLEALDLFRRAEAMGTDDASRREAQWGQVLCMNDLEMPETMAAVEELASGVTLEDAREAVRAACQRLVCETRFGGLDLSDPDRMSQLLPAVDDPIVESAFLSVYSSCLGLAARYDDARKAASSLLATAQRYRLAFALPYALCAAGIAEAGLRNWGEAERTLRKGIAEARSASNAHGEQSCLAALVRTLAQRGKYAAALALVHEHSLRPTAPVPVSMRIEFAATRALVLAASDRLDEATAATDSIRGLSEAVEARVLVAAVDAIVSLKRHDLHAVDRVIELSETAFTTGGLDLLVTSYRAVPELMAVLFRSPGSARLRELVHRIGDDDVAQALGHPVSRTDATAALTAREREVYALLREGLTNREIARLLFITEGTAKLHVQHVFDKLGVHSRKAIAMQAALERSVQATSAIDETGVGSDS